MAASETDGLDAIDVTLNGSRSTSGLASKE